MRCSPLVVDDDASSAHYMALALEELLGPVRQASGGQEALREVEREAPSLLVSDLRMPGMSGLDLLDRVHERWPEIPVILVTVDAEIATAVEAVRRGAINYLVKPVSPTCLCEAASRALETARLPNLSDVAIPEFVGTSRAAIQARRLVGLAARSDVNVLITGETGTGKELVACAIHRLSSSARGPFIAHNCAVTPTDLFESHFFGHVRGSFTGADRDRVGLLEEAHGGVLFLDELECFHPSHQAKLLRVLDSGEVQKVGSVERRPVSVRFVSATNREPSLLVREGAFREDLYYRLRGLEIRLLPLRERREDIRPLALHFLQGTGARLEGSAIAALERFPWPGNVRQLRNVLATARTFCEGGLIRRQHLVHEANLSSTVPSLASEAIPLGPESSPAGILKGTECQAILGALRAAGGHRGKAASALGIHRSTLRRKLKEYGIRL